MKNVITALLLFLMPVLGMAGSYSPETSVAGFIDLKGSGRIVYNFNPGWRFYKGEVKNGGAIGLDDSSWEVVATPHTVALEAAEASGGRNYQGPAWYRKPFCSR